MRKLLTPILAAVAFLFVSAMPASSQSSLVTITVRPNPLKVEISAPGSVAVGEWFKIVAAVTNHGNERIRRNRASINPSAGLSIRGSNKKGVGNLRPDETKTVTWWARVDSPGVKVVLLVEVVGTISGEEISTSDTVLIPTTTTLALLWKRFLGISFL